MRAKELAQDLKTTLKESDLADADSVKTHVNTAGNALQELIDDFIDESGLLRVKRDGEEVIVAVGSVVVGTISAPVAVAAAVATFVAGLIFDWW